MSHATHHSTFLSPGKPLEDVNLTGASVILCSGLGCAWTTFCILDAGMDPEVFLCCAQQAFHD